MNCAVPECPRPRRRREWCATHYARWRRSGSPTGTTREFAEHRFWRSVTKSSGCWEWTGHRMAFGHGRLRIDGRLVLAHRYSWSLAYGPIAPGMSVLHRCDNPPCVRPDHLFLGTRAENIHDMEATRVAACSRMGADRGMRAPNFRRPTSLNIRAARENGASLSVLAAEYKVTPELISRIARRLIWRHV